MQPCGKMPGAVVYSGVEGNNGILGNDPQLPGFGSNAAVFVFLLAPLFFRRKHFMITMNIEHRGRW